MATRTATALYHSYASAAAAVGKLEAAGIPHDDISIVSNDEENRGKNGDHPGTGTGASLGTVVGARSGDKGGSANLGVWVRQPAMFGWLLATLTETSLRTLLPELAELPIHRYPLPNLHAVNFVIDGLLGRGVGYRARFDPQAKGLGEWLRSRSVDIPVEFLHSGAPT